MAVSLRYKSKTPDPFERCGDASETTSDKRAAACELPPAQTSDTVTPAPAVCQPTPSCRINQIQNYLLLLVLVRKDYIKPQDSTNRTVLIF